MDILGAHHLPNPSMPDRLKQNGHFNKTSRWLRGTFQFGKPWPGSPASVDISQTRHRTPEERVQSGHEDRSSWLSGHSCKHALCLHMTSSPSWAFCPETWARRQPLIGGLSVSQCSPRGSKRAETCTQCEGGTEFAHHPHCKPKNGQSWEKVSKACFAPSEL